MAAQGLLHMRSCPSSLNMLEDKAAGGWKPKVAFGEEEVVEGHRAQPADLPSATREARVEKTSRIWGRTERAVSPVPRVMSSNLLRDRWAPFRLRTSALMMS